MSKKRKRRIDVCHISSIERTVMPKFNPFQTGHGTWKTDKHPSRARRTVLARMERDSQ